MDTLIPRHVSSCIRCGTCCRKGGPVLHHEDKKILLAGQAGYENLVTIRKGELAFNPARGKPEEVQREIVKVTGRGEDWTCCFYEEKDATCRIYQNRFLECRLLKCWDTSEIMHVIGRNTIVRSDIINPGDPVLSVIDTHEKECPSGEIEKLIASLRLGKHPSEPLMRLTDIVRRDLSIRAYAVSELGLKPEYEYFIFGRPLEKILNDRGLAMRTGNGEIHRKRKPRP